MTNLANKMSLKDKSRPCVSKLPSADVRDSGGVNSEFLLKPGTDLPPEIVQ